MGMFNSVIQSLSEMTIKENSINVPTTTSNNVMDELLEMVENMPLLNERECIFPIQAVPIINSNNYGYLIELADISKYMVTNNITSITEAIGNILNYNNLEGQYHRISLVVDEESILESLSSLGYNVNTDNWQVQPKKGLGMPLVSDCHTKFDSIRKIANTKQLMDILTGRYGLPLVKRNYTKVGLLEQFDLEEDVEPKVNKNDKLLHEKPFNGDKEASRSPQPGDVTAELHESANIVEEKSDHEKYLDVLRGIANGSYDDEIAVTNETGFLDMKVKQALFNK